MTSGNGDAGGISPGGRMARIEHALGEIRDDQKSMMDRLERALDSKADVELVHDMRERVKDIEYGRGPLAERLADQSRTMRQAIEDISAHGSRQAQEAVKGVRELRAEVERLSSERSRRLGAQEEKVESFERAIKIVGVILAAVTGLAVILGAIAAVLTVLH